MSNLPGARLMADPNPPTITVNNLRRNLVAFFCPRLKVRPRKFRKLALLKLLAVSERHGFVSEQCQCRTAERSARGFSNLAHLNVSR
jgi:hypothetical protein